MSGGAQANESGKFWELLVREAVKRQGFDVRPYRERAACEVPVSERRILWTHAPYRTIFANEKQQKEGKTATEFVIECGTDQVRIECKWQNTAGSVDEKYLFALMNAGITIQEPTVILALGGSYFRRGRGLDVKNWLADACRNPPEWLAPEVRKRWCEKEILVLDTDTVGKWIRDRFPLRK